MLMNLCTIVGLSLSTATANTSVGIESFMGLKFGQTRLYNNSSSFAPTFYSKEIATNDTIIGGKKFTTLVECRCDSLTMTCDSILRIKHIRPEGNRIEVVNEFGSGFGFPELYTHDTAFIYQGARFDFRYDEGDDSGDSATISIFYPMDPSVITEVYKQNIGLSSFSMMGLQGSYRRKTLVKATYSPMGLFPLRQINPVFKSKRHDALGRIENRNQNTLRISL